MTDVHAGGKENAKHILNWYGYYSECEYNHPAIGRDRIDVIGRRKTDIPPFIGIEVHIKGVLDDDLIKLRNLQSLDHRVVLTPNRELINSMKTTKTGIEWFLMPSRNEIGFESFIRHISNTPMEKPFFFDMLETLRSASPDPDFVKLTEQIESAGLDVPLALKVIYNGALENFHNDDGLRSSKEFIFLQSFGIIDGLEIYWYDMKYGDDLKYSFDGIKSSNWSSRKMAGQPLYYDSNKVFIRGAVKEFVHGKHSELESSIEQYSVTLREIALMGRMGRINKSTYTDKFSYEMSFSPDLLYFESLSTEAKRLMALASNPIIDNDVWNLYTTLVDLGLAKRDSNIIRTLYKPIAEEIACIGAIKKYDDAVNEYLSWWVMVQGGIKKASMQAYCNALNIPWDLVENCIDKTVTKGLTSPFIDKNGGLRRTMNFVKPYGDKGGASDIAIYNRGDFLDFCSAKMKENLEKII